MYKNVAIVGIKLNKKHFDFNILPIKARRIIDKLRLKNIPFWIVGGFVRDWCAGIINSRDIDIVAKKNVWALRRILGGEIIFCKFPHILLNDIEVLTIHDITRTLKQRDFTVNAMAIDANGGMIDPFNGYADIKNKIFRSLSIANLEGDPIQLLRGCRLASRLGWKFDIRTYASMQKFAKKYNWSRYVHKKGIKIAIEIVKSFEDPQPSKFFSQLHDFDVLKYIFPLLEKLYSNPAALNKGYSLCDSLDPGESSLRMFAILYSIINSSSISSMKLLREMDSYLKRIYWNTAASNFGRYKEFLDIQNILDLIMYVNLDFSKSKNQIINACNAGKFNLQEYLLIREKILGISESRDNIIKISRQIVPQKNMKQYQYIKRKVKQK